ncbi:class III lanthionine synthetase LanKC N-terminal domain-containing protein [Streptomyces phytophilus]|uniref:class III lanthionine synthetase LanKC N-terminal domain-containing protein n=1 Tax=Streptomyces phytophilus TaxID=722715 RepID=UPI0035A8FB76
MDKRYEAFCLADEYFYETPDRLTGAAGAPAALFPVARRETPGEWVDAWSGDWRQLQPLADRRWPEQGWKIHVSARLDNADRVGTYIWDYCVPRGIPFKFVPGKQLLYLRNSKYASRTISGKFATIYPRDDEMLHTVLRELGGQLAAEDGPYILTDLRWQGGPLHVRYGGFAPRYCVGADGARPGRGGERAGLLRGWTGSALFFVRLYKRTRDPALLDAAAARAAVLPAVRMRYYAQPGLFQGRAGMLLRLGRTATPGHRGASRAHNPAGIPTARPRPGP